jgi:sporulation protein YlmC with PRC-barrel domain
VNSYLVNLNELSKKDTIDSEGKIKGLITDERLYINTKGINQYAINSYHRFIITTNKEDPIKTEKDDRRNLIIRCSDEKIGDKEYFEKLHKYIDDINVIRTCYDYFKSIPDMDKFNIIPIPKTEYQNNLKELYKTPIESWLEDFTIKNIDKNIIEMLGKDTFMDFEEWKINNNITYETTPKKLGVALINMDTNKGITKGRHTNKGETKYFNISILKKNFNIGCLINLDDEREQKK